jgi:hypothetical protein
VYSSISERGIARNNSAQHGLWPGPEYWEGAASVAGGSAGKAYVELNGFCRGAEGTLAF